MPSTPTKGYSQCFEEVLKQTQGNLQSNGLILEEILADTGYSSGATLQYLEDDNIEGYIPIKVVINLSAWDLFMTMIKVAERVKEVQKNILSSYIVYVQQ